MSKPIHHREKTQNWWIEDNLLTQIPAYYRIHRPILRYQCRKWSWGGGEGGERGSEGEWDWGLRKLQENVVPYTFQPSIPSCFDYQFAIVKIKIRVSNSDNQSVKMFFIIIHQIFSLARDWSKRLT